MCVGPSLADALCFADRIVNSFEWLRQVDVLGKCGEQRDRRIGVGLVAGGEFDSVSGYEERTGCGRASGRILRIE